MSTKKANGTGSANTAASGAIQIGTTTISKAMMDCLETTAWGEKHFGGIITNRQLPLTVMRRCVKAGLCKSNGMGYVCDADGFIEQPEKMRRCYVLTDKGREAIRQYYARFQTQC